MASKQAEVKSLFAFIKLCGKLKVGSYQLLVLVQNYCSVDVAPETHRVGAERSEGSRKRGVSLFSNGNDGIFVRRWRCRSFRQQRKVVYTCPRL